MSRTTETLRALPFFESLPDDLLDQVVKGAEEIELDRGQTLISEGDRGDSFYVVLDGELEISKQSGGRDVVLNHVGRGAVQGELALLEDAPRQATVTTVTPARLLRVPASGFRSLLADPGFSLEMLKTVTRRLRETEVSLRHGERMAALGKMAAQLMHELNNPAAAIARSAGELSDLEAALSEESMTVIGALGGELAARDNEPAEMSALERADAEENIASWLAKASVPEPWRLAPPLVASGWTTEHLEQAAQGVRPELAQHLIRWVGLNAAARQVSGEVAIAARRISELVRIVKEYSFLDEAPIQEVDVTTGISDTLILLKHKLREVDVKVEFEPGLPTVEVPGRELNQVWTNLIDNAADAMEDGGTLTVRARSTGDGLRVEIGDTGGGISPELRDRIFDPFFTTKEPGKGTGLGLHTVYSIVNRMGGEISVASDDQGSTFTVTIPSAVRTEPREG